MITREQLAASFVHESNVCKHLFSKLGSEALGYRPSPGQRSTLELLRYLASCGIGGVICMAENDWKKFGDYIARTEKMPAEAFPEAMDRQQREIEEFFANTSEETLEMREASLPGQGKRPLGVAIMNGPLKWLTAYKMQLFLYAKATGADAISTANAWAGFDWKG